MPPVDEDLAAAPLDDCEYSVVLGESLTEPAEDEARPDSVAATFGYEFQPASADTSAIGLVSVDSSNGVQVQMGSSSGAAGGVSFKGKLVEHKETDCLLIFDGSGFRLERCPFSCLQLRHVRAPTPRRRVKIHGSAASGLVATGVTGKRPRGRPKGAVSRKSSEKGKRPVGGPKGSTSAAKKARVEAKRA